MHTITPFVARSAAHAKSKAKHLQKAFPHLKLSAAQEATARALGFSSWFECQRPVGGKPSPLDEDLSLDDRVRRLYHQATTLMVVLDIPPMDADSWARKWGLTGQATMRPETPQLLYFQWEDLLNKVARGEIPEADFLENYRSEYDDSVPTRIGPGAIIGPVGSKYQHIALHPDLWRQIPVYLRGGRSAFHVDDDWTMLRLALPGQFPAARKSTVTKKEIGEFFYTEPVLHEWHFGKPKRNHPPIVAALEAASAADPEGLYALSVRYLIGEGQRQEGLYEIPCLKGRDFAAFIRSKGAFDPAKVIWYRGVPEENVVRWNPAWVHYGFGPDSPKFNVPDGLLPSSPLYSYPFKNGPMCSDEYHSGLERSGSIGLHERYEEDEEDEQDGDDAGESMTTEEGLALMAKALAESQARALARAYAKSPPNEDPSKPQ